MCDERRAEKQKLTAIKWPSIIALTFHGLITAVWRHNDPRGRRGLGAGGGEGMGGQWGVGGGGRGGGQGEAVSEKSTPKTPGRSAHPSIYHHQPLSAVCGPNLAVLILSGDVGAYIDSL